MIQEGKPSGFVAGTLVHTDKGLVPIEQLKVGDMVLSKSEIGAENSSYKRVSNISTSLEPQAVYRLTLGRWDANIGQIHSFLFISSSSTFYVKEHIETYDKPRLPVRGWVQLPHVKCGDVIETLSNYEFMVIGVDEVNHVVNSIGLCLDLHSHQYGDFLIDFSTLPFTILVGIDPIVRDWSDDLSCLMYDDSVTIYESENDNPLIDQWNFASKTNTTIGGWMHQKVYNIKVEDSHTYFVGKAGILVHDATANIS